MTYKHDSSLEGIVLLERMHATFSKAVTTRGVQIRSDSFGFRNQNIHFGSDRIDKVVS
jgi:hypothetical protein